MLARVLLGGAVVLGAVAAFSYSNPTALRPALRSAPETTAVLRPTPQQYVDLTSYRLIVVDTANTKDRHVPTLKDKAGNPVCWTYLKSADMACIPASKLDAAAQVAPLATVIDGQPVIVLHIGEKIQLPKTLPVRTVPGQRA